MQARMSPRGRYDIDPALARQRGTSSQGLGQLRQGDGEVTYEYVDTSSQANASVIAENHELRSEAAQANDAARRAREIADKAQQSEAKTNAMMKSQKEQIDMLIAQLARSTAGHTAGNYFVAPGPTGRAGIASGGHNLLPHEVAL